MCACVKVSTSGVPWVSGARGKKWNQRPFFLIFFHTKNCKMVDPELISVIFKSEKQKNKAKKKQKKTKTKTKKQKQNET